MYFKKFRNNNIHLGDNCIQNFHLGWQYARKCDVTNEIKLFPTVYYRILYDIILTDIMLQKQVH